MTETNYRPALVGNGSAIHLARDSERYGRVTLCGAGMANTVRAHGKSPIRFLDDADQGATCVRCRKAARI